MLNSAEMHRMIRMTFLHTCLLLYAGVYLFSTPLFAQTITVFDRATLQPLEGVAIASDSAGSCASTNAKGQADLSVLKGATSITLSHLGYRSLTLSMDAIADGKVLLEQQPYNLDELVVSASRFQERKRDVPEHIDVIERRTIALLDQQTTPDLLQNSGALFVQRSQMGGGSPVIRGFEASRVLLVVDGVRMNNAIYRAGHLQDLMTVDPNALDRIEVISGPGSVVYGSDALGGVIHLLTRTPRFSDSTGFLVNGGAMLRTSTANNERTANATVELRCRKLSSLTSITASDFGDLRMGSMREARYRDWGMRYWTVEQVDGNDTVVPNSDPLIQSPTAYKQVDVLQKLRLRTGERTMHQLNAQFSTTTDVPRYDRLTEYDVNNIFEIVPAQAEWYYGPQKRVLLAYTLELEREQGLYSKARITPSYQYIEQSRHNRGFGSSRLGHRTETVQVFGLSADFEKRFGKHELRCGAEYYANEVASEAHREDIHTGEVSYLSTRYPNGGSTMNTLAAYVSHTIEMNERWVLSEGLRFSAVELESTFDDDLDYQFLNGTYAQQNNALNWRVGAAFMPGKDWRFSALASTGFRAPNVDDMGKVFDSVQGTVVVPNTGLKPETTTNFEMGLSKTIDQRFTLEGNAFYTFYNNALTVSDFTVNGSDSIDYDGVLSKVTALTNKKEAYLYGTQAQVVFAFDAHFTLRSGLTYTVGRVRTDSTDQPLDHIAPVYGRTSLQWQAKRVTAECYVLYNGWKYLSDYNSGTQPAGEPAGAVVAAAYLRGHEIRRRHLSRKQLR
ncbi:MAG: TonB-dependent receptor [Flavobacteriales bacterium]|nr:TonB-dependent receptor [Flavobacteriales bacterium]